MRSALLIVLLAGSLSAQSMLEHAAAAAGGSVGGVAGKKVSDGLTTIFQKMDKQTQKAAKTGDTKKQPSPAAAASDSSAPLLEVGPGVPKGDTSNVPPPPPVKRASVRKTAPAPLPVVIEPPPPAPVAPPPPAVTADDLKTLTNGMPRASVLKLGEPAARISMVEDGHLLEIYRYQQKDTTLGVVRLTDGSVSNVAVR